MVYQFGLFCHLLFLYLTMIIWFLYKALGPRCRGISKGSLSAGERAPGKNSMHKNTIPKVILIIERG